MENPDWSETKQGRFERRPTRHKSRVRSHPVPSARAPRSRVRFLSRYSGTGGGREMMITREPVAEQSAAGFLGQNSAYSPRLNPGPLVNQGAGLFQALIQNFATTNCSGLNRDAG